MGDWKDNIHFVLVEPREAGNIGASARAMKNMGFKKLCLVRPAALTDETRWLAHNSLDVLDHAAVRDTLSGALADKALVVGVARRTGKRRGMSLPLRKGVQRLREAARGNRIALLFGREDRGLYNEETDECGFLLTIPADREHPSLNLSHAVMVVAYELSQAGQGETPGTQQRRAKRECLVGHGELESLFERMTRALVLLDYMPHGDRDLQKHIMENLKHFIGRAGLTDWELKMLHGLCSQIERKVGR